MNMFTQSLLDTDLYKLTMQQAVMEKFPNVNVRYKFIDRDGHNYPEAFGKKLRQAVSAMSEIRLTDEEAEYLSKLPFMKPFYIEYLKNYKFDPNEVNIVQYGNGNLFINIEGPWHSTILWETPLLATISELYYRETNEIYSEKQIRAYADERLKSFDVEGKKIAEFGTRRRYNQYAQEILLKDANIRATSPIAGTSNIHFAKKFNLKPIGTMAHEWVSFHGAMYGYRSANEMALVNWSDVYSGDLGIALIDTFTTSKFLKTFDQKSAKLFDGVRQDSGDPIKIGKAVIDHYKKLGINPKTKTLIFSDGLCPPTPSILQEKFHDEINVSFGIGTHLTNYMAEQPKNIVIKLVEADIRDREVPVIKLSDDKGKHTGDIDEINACKQILGISE